MAPVVRRTWAPCGQDPAIETIGPVFSSKGLSRLPSLSFPSRSLVPCPSSSSSHRRRDRDIVNAVLALAFLIELKPHITGRCIVVWHRLRTHKAEIVSRIHRLSMRASHQKLLLPHAPELNPRPRPLGIPQDTVDWFTPYSVVVDDLGCEDWC